MVVDPGAAEGELDKARLAEQHRPRLPQPAGAGRVPGRHLVPEQQRSPRSRQPGNVDEVLDRQRDAVEGADVVPALDRGLRGAGGRQGAVGGDAEVGVELLVAAADAVEVVLGDLDRGELAFLEGRGQAGYGGKRFEARAHGDIPPGRGFSNGASERR